MRLGFGARLVLLAWPPLPGISGSYRVGATRLRVGLRRTVSDVISLSGATLAAMPVTTGRVMPFTRAYSPLGLLSSSLSDRYSLFARSVPFLSSLYILDS